MAEKFYGITKALKDGYTLKTDSSGGGCRGAYLTKGGEEKKEYDSLMPNLREALIVLSLKYLAGEEGKQEDTYHYMTGDPNIRSNLDWWVWHGADFCAKYSEGYIVCNVSKRNGVKPLSSATTRTFCESFDKIEENMSQKTRKELQDILLGISH